LLFSPLSFSRREVLRPQISDSGYRPLPSCFGVSLLVLGGIPFSRYRLCRFFFSLLFLEVRNWSFSPSKVIWDLHFLSKEERQSIFFSLNPCLTPPPPPLFLPPERCHAVVHISTGKPPSSKCRCFEYNGHNFFVPPLPLILASSHYEAYVVFKTALRDRSVHHLPPPRVVACNSTGVLFLGRA